MSDTQDRQKDFLVFLKWSRENTSPSLIINHDDYSFVAFRDSHGEVSYGWLANTPGVHFVDLDY